MKSLQEELKEYVVALIEGKTLSLVNIKGGSVIEAFDHALAEAVRNCADINTTLEAREVILKVKVQPNKDRDMMGFKIAVTKKLAGLEPIEGTANIEVDPKGKGFVATRRPEAVQSSLFGNVTPIIGGKE